MTTSTETPTLPETKLWTERVGAFAMTLGLKLDVVNEKLKALIGDPSDDKVATLADPDCTSDADLVAAFSDVPKAMVKRGVKEFRAAAAPPTAVQASTSPSVTNTSFTSLLPQVPSDDDFLAMLQIGGVAKMEPQDVMSAIRVLFASEIGVFDIDNEILAMIEQRSLTIDEPCPEIYYTLQKQIGRKAHGEVLKALGVPGTFASGPRKTAFVERMKGLWGTLTAFQQGIDSWFTSWQAKMNNPALLIGMFATMANGNGATPLVGMNDAPDTQPTVDAARSVIDTLNKIFAGPGIPVARAGGRCRPVAPAAREPRAGLGRRCRDARGDAPEAPHRRRRRHRARRARHHPVRAVGDEAPRHRHDAAADVHHGAAAARHDPALEQARRWQRRSYARRSGSRAA
jgi:hypothetical protein